MYLFILIKKKLKCNNWENNSYETAFEIKIKKKLKKGQKGNPLSEALCKTLYFLPKTDATTNQRHQLKHRYFKIKKKRQKNKKRKEKQQQ